MSSKYFRIVNVIAYNLDENTWKAETLSMLTPNLLIKHIPLHVCQIIKARNTLIS